VVVFSILIQGLSIGKVVRAQCGKAGLPGIGGFPPGLRRGESTAGARNHGQ